MKLQGDKVIFSFSKDHEPVLRVPAGTTLEIETLDCFSNQLRDSHDTMDQLDWDRVNPATGPIYIEGAEPGDTLKVTIHSIKLNEKGTICCLENEGTLGHMIEGSHIRVVKVEGDTVKFLDKFDIPTQKMVGVIGVAPKGEAVNTGTPGPHGGNMDTILVAEGATVYFPVEHPGALFAMGDVHAAMGDGEIGVSGLEIPADVTVTLDVIKGKAPEYPVLENDDVFAILVSKTTVDEAISTATELMCRFLEPRMDITRPEIVMLMSLVGNAQISQVVDPEKTVRFVFPKKYMKKAEF
ncbi:MAG: acetamidase/formamidase family protein [Anaerovoracaceae bacterium]|jgi:amidase|nr:acetamidase/formamidase family protein [Anaerovoracaceae bacterium]